MKESIMCILNLREQWWSRVGFLILTRAVDPEHFRLQSKTEQVAFTQPPCSPCTSLGPQDPERGQCTSLALKCPLPQHWVAFDVHQFPRPVYKTAASTYSRAIWWILQQQEWAGAGSQATARMVLLLRKTSMHPQPQKWWEGTIYEGPLHSQPVACMHF